MKIGAKAILLLGGLALVPALVPLPIVLPGYADALVLAAQNEQLHVAKELEAAVDAHVGRRVDDGRRLARTIDGASRAGSDADGALAVQLAFDAQESFDVVRLVISREGSPDVEQVYAKAGADKARAPRGTPELARQAAEQGVAIGEPEGEDGRTRTLVFALPSSSPKVRAHLVAPLYLQPLDQAIDAQRELHARGDAEMDAWIVDADHRLVTGGSDSPRARGEPLGSVCTLDLLSGLPAGAPVGVSGVCDGGGGQVGSVHTTSRLPWAVVIVQPRSVVLAEYERARGTLFGAAAAAALVAIALAVVASRGITRPVLRLVEQSRRLGRRAWGELLPSSGRRDELGELEAALSDAGTSLEQQERALATEARVRADLTRFLSPELVERAVKGDLDMKLGGRRREISVLFADVVAFTPLAEKRPAEEAVAVLNELFALLTEIIFRHGGFVDKFIGDAVMAVFGAPDDAPDHADRALRCAEDMMRFLEVAKDTFEKKHQATIRLSIGVNSGEAVVGNVGSEQRMDYTAIGDVVNVAARLEALAGPNQVLVAEGTEARAQEPFELRRLGARRLVGREEDTVVFELVVD